MKINSILDGIRSLGSLVDNTEDKTNENILFLEKYNLFSVVNIKLNFSNKVIGRYVELKLSSYDDFISADEYKDNNLWSKYFVLKDDLFKIDKNVKVKESNDDYAFLTKNIISELSAYNDDDTYSFNNLKCDFEITDDILRKYPGILVPLSEVEKKVPRIGQIVNINFNNLKGTIEFSEDKKIEIKNNTIRLSNFSFFQTSIYSRKITSVEDKIDPISISDVYVLKNGEIDPSSVMSENADTNISMFKDLISTRYIKAGDTALLILEEEPSYKDDLSPVIDEHIKNSPDKVEFDKNYIVTKTTYQEVISKMMSQYATI